MNDAKKERVVRKGKILKARFGPRPKTGTYRVTAGLPSRTQQGFKDECDIMSIVKNYPAELEARRAKMRFVDTTVLPKDLHEQFAVVQEAADLFSQLPNEVREKCHHDPAQFFKYIQDESKFEEHLQLGLLNPEAPNVKAKIAEKEKAAQVQQNQSVTPTKPAEKPAEKPPTSTLAQ